MQVYSSCTGVDRPNVWCSVNTTAAGSHIPGYEADCPASCTAPASCTPGTSFTQVQHTSFISSFPSILYPGLQHLRVWIRRAASLQQLRVHHHQHHHSSPDHHNHSDHHNHDHDHDHHHPGLPLYPGLSHHSRLQHLRL